MVGVSMIGSTPADWIAEATSLSLERFVELHSCPFLIGMPSLRTPRPLAVTLAGNSALAALRRADTQKIAAVDVDNLPEVSRARPVRLVLPLRKRTDVFPAVVSVGRAP